MSSNQIAWIQLTDTCTQNQKLTEQENHSAARDQIGKRGLVSSPDYFFSCMKKNSLGMRLGGGGGGGGGGIGRKRFTNITVLSHGGLEKPSGHIDNVPRLSPENWTVLVSHSLTPVRVRLCSLTPAYYRVWK